MDLFLVRHGQSHNNALEDLSDRLPDPPLTKKGGEQAGRVAAHLSQGGHLPGHERGNGRPFIEELYCSPMLRALETARPIGETLGVSPQVWVDIHEVGGLFLDHGEEVGVEGFPGKTRQQIQDEFKGFDAEEVGDEGWWRGKRETDQAGRGRAIGVAAKLMARSGEDVRIALVSHGDFICGLLKAVTNHLPSWGLWYDHHNTAITRMTLRESGRVVVGYMNRADHLSDDLLS